MPIKKSKKPVKKPVKNPKSKLVKKVAAKQKSPKKPLKKIVKKASKKIAVKKVVLKKPAKKIPVKQVVKKASKPVKSTKKLAKKIEKKPAKPILNKSSLAKTILAKKDRHSDNKNLDSKNPEKKGEVITRSIFLKKYENRGNKVVFKVGDFAVYPSHGVGKIIEIEKTSILGHDLSCYLMYFEKERLTIKIPTTSADRIGLRPLISKSQTDEVFTILRSGVKKLKGMWSRRAQEYETKINSGDIILLAEVLRDLTRDIEDSERSYSERIIYETAIYRLASEYSVICGITFEEAKDKVITTAKDKLNAEGKINQKDEFDEFDDLDPKSSNLDEDEDEESEDEDEEDEDGDEDDDYDDDDDDAPKRKKRK